jgi:hypothetical protein
VVGQLRRRREAAQRLPSLDCGCGPDPWLCRCTDPPLTGRQLDGWRDAALRVLFNRQVPILPIEVLRALYRRGSSDRILAERLHSASGGEIA